MKKLTEKEIEIRDKCRSICNRYNREVAKEKIKIEYPGCLVSIDMIEENSMKMFMGMFLWKNFNITF